MLFPNDVVNLNDTNSKYNISNDTLNTTLYLSELSNNNTITNGKMYIKYDSGNTDRIIININESNKLIIPKARCSINASDKYGTLLNNLYNLKPRFHFIITFIILTSHYWIS